MPKQEFLVINTPLGESNIFTVKEDVIFRLKCLSANTEIISYFSVRHSCI